ncbi:phage major capsid protein [Sphingomonas sp. MA1305]|uniref:phage major capsid protein n=1 Tax=Sphingomonas sp. MA1305 TaxID=2479204 RepID=UPI0018E01C1D|nr:phage major capsid protein [Sphingomonas sp. MA1305]MBI0476098.1 phage major capsid protein [Sphingomonas sp. MA1305]
MDVVERPALDGARAERGEAFAGFVRTGATLEMKAFTGVSGDAGGYAVPHEIDATIASVLRGLSPIRAIANVVQVGSPDRASRHLPGRRTSAASRICRVSTC